MKVDNVGFKIGFIEGIKTEKEFLDKMEGEGYKHIFSGKDRVVKLKKVYALHHPKKHKEVEK